MARFTFVLISLAACSTCADKAPLPDVDTVLTKATSKAHAFAEQAAVMQQKLAEQQEKSRANLAMQKKDFEQRLDRMQHQSENISARNSELQRDNRAIERQNMNLLAELEGIQENNSKLRATLRSLTDKVAAAELFTVDSLKVTDDSLAQELMVLAPTTRKPTLEQFLHFTNGREVSMLAIRARLRGDPGELVSSLSSSLTEIQAADDEGAAELKAQFLASMATKEERQAQLNATQAKLLQTKAELQEHHGKLLDAKVHLMATSKQLRERLGGMLVFADTVGASVDSALGAGDVKKLGGAADYTQKLTPAIQSNSTQLAATNQSDATKLAVAHRSNATRALNASLAVATKSTTVANQTFDVVNQTVIALGRAAAAVVQVAKVATQTVPKQPVSTLSSLRKTATVAQAAKTNDGDAWRSWLAKLR